MATPLRKAAGGYESYALPQKTTERRPKPGRNVDLAPRRLVRRQIRSNAEIRRTVAWVLLGWSSVLFLMGITYIFVKAGVSQMNYSINAIQAENEQIILENDKIRGRIAELRSLERIEAIASQDLGMVKNEHVEYMVLSSTIVAEGKIRSEAEKPKQGQEETGSLDKVIYFLLSLVDRKW